MGKITEKVAYIKGLLDGVQLEGDSKEGKVLCAIVDALEVIADELDKHDDAIDDLIEGVDSLNEDLSDIEEFVFSVDDDDDDEEDEDFGDDFIELECPECGDTVYYDSELFDEGEDPVCPNCGSTVKLVSEELSF